MFVQLVQVCFAKPLAKKNRQSRLTRKHGILSFQDMKSTSWLNSPHLLGFLAGSPVEFPPEEDLQQEVKSLAAPSWQQPEVGKTWSGTNGSWFGGS